MTVRSEVTRPGTQPVSIDYHMAKKGAVWKVYDVLVMGFRQFLLRGLVNVRNEWTLVCLAWNLKRMAVLRPNCALKGWKRQEMAGIR